MRRPTEGHESEPRDLIHPGALVVTGKSRMTKLKRHNHAASPSHEVIVPDASATGFLLLPCGRGGNHNDQVQVLHVPMPRLRI